MIKNKIRLILAAYFCLISIVSHAKDKKIVGDFSLLNTDGKMVSLKDFQEAKGFIVVFTCNHCPFAKLYPDRLNALNAKYKPLGFPLLAISSTDTVQYEEDTYLKMIEKASLQKYNFPYLFDGTQAVAKQYGAEKTPHAFVIYKENETWVVKYDGAIDDNGAEPEKVTENYVAMAVESLLANKKIKIHQTKSIGCQIHFRK